MKLTRISALATAALVLTLSACASDAGPAEVGSKEAKDGSELTMLVELDIKDVPEEEISFKEPTDADWTTEFDGNVLNYYAAGSGSCKPIIESAVLDGNKIILTRFDYSGKPCTMDLRRFQQQITRVAGGEFPVDAVVEVVIPDAVN